MARFLPPQPNFEHLRNEAKSLQKAHQRKDPGVCTTLRRMHRFKDASDEQILAADLSLTEAQFALAMDYGFADWGALREAVLSHNPPQDYQAEAQADALLLPAPRPGPAGPWRFDVVFSRALTYMGIAADPVSVAGDSGMAFILQADSLHRPWGTDRKELDIGWWPLDPWGVMLRLNFLSRAYGVPMRRLGSIESEYAADSAEHYRKHYHIEVLRSLRAGRPVLAIADGPCVIYGCDSGNPPLLGQLSCDAGAGFQRIKKYPWEIVIPGEAGVPMSRRQADAEALEFAVRLGRDEVDLSRLPGKLSGRKAWELWLSQLEDPELCGPHFYHANVKGQTRMNRMAAAGYLRAMSRRHDARPAEALMAAAAGYDAVVEKLRKADTGKEAFGTETGRRAFMALIREIMALEADCHERIAEALRCIPANL